jgi:nucleotide-binding universal stress UspA family protein
MNIYSSAAFHPHLETTPVALRNILVATDFSPASRRAFELGSGLARQYSAKLTLLHVQPPITAAPVTGSEWKLQEELSWEARHKLSLLATHESVRDLNVHTVLSVGAVGDEVDRVIEEQRIDLLIIGTHGAQGLEKLVLGSMAEALFRSSRVPVITVGPRTRAADLHLPFRHILFATDLSGRCLRAAQYAASLAEESDAELTLLHVLSDRQSDNDLTWKVATEEMKQLLPADVENWCKPLFVVREGEPAEEILRTEKETAADLIVMAVSMPNVLSDHTPWATASQVVRRAHAPVLTVRNRL